MQELIQYPNGRKGVFRMNIREFLESVLHLTDENTVHQLSAVAKVEHLKKNSILAEAGEIQAQLPVLIKGILRGFVIDADGRDVTDCFVYRYGDIAVGCNLLGTPSQISMEAMTDCDLISVPMAPVLDLLETSPDLMRLYNGYLFEALNRHWEEKMLMHQCSAMQRYLWFLREYPGLIDLISNKHIASFLGMTPVTLSRLRRQLGETRRSRAESDGPDEHPRGAAPVGAGCGQSK